MRHTQVCHTHVGPHPRPLVKILDYNTLQRTETTLNCNPHMCHSKVRHTRMGPSPQHLVENVQSLLAAQFTS